MLVQRQGSQSGVGGDGGLAESPRLSRELSFHHSDMSHLHFEPSPAPLHPSPQPPQSSDDEEEWSCPHPISPPRTLGVLSPSSSSRGPASCSAFPIPSRPNTLSCHPPGYLHRRACPVLAVPSMWVENSIQWPENLPRLIGNVPVINISAKCYVASCSFPDNFKVKCIVSGAKSCSVLSKTNEHKSDSYPSHKRNPRL